MTAKKTLLIVCLVLVGFVPSIATAVETGIPSGRLLTDDELVALLDGHRNPALESIQRLYRENPEQGFQALAAYFRAAFSERYYFDWKKTPERFAQYSQQFPGKRAGHAQNRDIHMGLYPAYARWKLPYENLEGNSVTAYELRHLARQHKVLDMAFMHHYEDQNPLYVDYFIQQMRSLNAAFEAGEYEDDEGGNGVYESFRAGYRVLNWLQVHALFLGAENYDDPAQLDLVRTMLHTGATLHAKNPAFRYGNHQTRGMVALAMIAILFKDYADTDTWYRDAMAILGEHLEKEVNSDGFQFERSVHYHVGDIYNYFRVMQLAQLNGFAVPDEWRSKLKAMFDSAVILARPDRRLPVLQDDTDQPWAEYNKMGDFMLLGAVLFDDPVINYFAGDSVESGVYWLLRQDQLDSLSKLKRQRPQTASAELPDTGYYVMRDGWQEGDLYMTITAGLSEHKPDHQHGDMLGLVAHVGGQEILPNYQVRYSLPDFEYFKNSYVKNVALVDGIPHGIDWRSNRGGSGFGKWGKLPQPEVIAWLKRDDWDFFAGSHDGYNNMGVGYFRKVIFLKGLGWIVKDIFESSAGTHQFQQLWQGHYSAESNGGRFGNHHRSAFADGSGLEIVQLGSRADAASNPTKRGKGSLVYSIAGESGEFTTLLYPYSGFDNRLPAAFFSGDGLSAKGWTIHAAVDSESTVGRFATNARLSVEHSGGVFLLSASWIAYGEARWVLPERGDYHLAYRQDGSVELTNLGHRAIAIHSRGWGDTQLQPGASMILP